MINGKKIICTVGHSPLDGRVLKRLKSGGADFFRINLSHTDKQDIELKVEELLEKGLNVMLDTEGSQVRTGNLKEIFLEKGQILKIYDSEIICDDSNLFLTPLNIVQKLNIGDLLFLDFNSALIKIVEGYDSEKGFCLAEVIIRGNCGYHKGVHISSLHKLDLPFLSEKDLYAIDLAKRKGLKNFTLSFVRKKEDIEYFKKLYPEANFMAKIETSDAVANIDSILDLSPGLLIDRGDLSREIPFQKIPFVQEMISKKCIDRGKDLFVATNTLERMAFELMPDKSEVSDIIKCLDDGVGGFALTKEIAVGKYPIETLNTLTSLIKNYDHSRNKNVDTPLDFSRNFMLIEPHGGHLINQVEPSPSEATLESMKKLFVKDEVLMDVENIAVGAFSPLKGFMNKKDLLSVLDSYRLSNGTLWPLPVVLQVNNSEGLTVGDKVLLIREREDVAYAILELEEIYSVDKEELVKKWFGTNSEEHPGVTKILTGGDVFLAGKVTLIKRRPHKNKKYELTPRQTREIFSSLGWSKIVGFHSRNVVHKSHEFIQRKSLEKCNGDGLFLHPVIGKKKEGDFESGIIVNSYELLIKNNFEKNPAIFSVLSTYSRYSGPREALFTALVRKNFGCTHFIIGRDHTGVKDFYHPTASQEIFDKFNKEEIGITPVKFGEVRYCENSGDYVETDFLLENKPENTLSISGTQARKVLQLGGKLPGWFMDEEISKMISDKISKREKVFVEKGKVVLITGLSGSGKSTLAIKLKEYLEKRSKKVRIIDGDEIRTKFNPHLGFTREDIETNGAFIKKFCEANITDYDFILVPVIFPFEKSRKLMKDQFNKNFVEIYLDCSLECCRQRDVKGIYKKFYDGEITNLIGADPNTPYEIPSSPDLIISTGDMSEEDCLEKIRDYLKI